MARSTNTKHEREGRNERDQRSTLRSYKYGVRVESAWPAKRGRLNPEPAKRLKGGGGSLGVQMGQSGKQTRGGYKPVNFFFSLFMGGRCVLF